MYFLLNSRGQDWANAYGKDPSLTVCPTEAENWYYWKDGNGFTYGGEDLRLTCSGNIFKKRHTCTGSTL